MNENENDAGVSGQLKQEKGAWSGWVAGRGDATQGNWPRRDGLMERIKRNRHQAELSAEKLQAYGELEYLFDKNPEVARILELMDIIREVL